MVTDVSKLKNRYMKNFEFKRDIVCIFPTDLLYAIPAIGKHGTTFLTLGSSVILGITVWTLISNVVNVF